MEKSPDAFRTISEVADHLETPAHVLRFWESRFPQIKPVKRAGGRRYYRPSDVALLAGIKRLLHDEGMTIRGVQKMLREQGVRQVAAFGSDETGLEEVFAVDERLLEGIPGVGPEPPSAEIVPFGARAPREGPAITDPNLRDGTEPAEPPDLSAPRPLLPPLPVTALEVQDETVLAPEEPAGPGLPSAAADGEPEDGPEGGMFADLSDDFARDLGALAAEDGIGADALVAPDEGAEEAAAEAEAEDYRFDYSVAEDEAGDDAGAWVSSADEEAPFVDTEAEPGWHRAVEGATLHRLGPAPEPAEATDADSGEGDEIAVELLVAGVLVEDEAEPEDAAEAAAAPDADEAVGDAGSGDMPPPDDGVADDELEDAEAAMAGAMPAEAPARQADLWSAAGLAAPPPVPPRPRGVDSLAEDTDDLLDIELTSVMPILTRLRACPPEAVAEQAAALAGLRDRLAGLRESMAAAARVRAR